MVKDNETSGERRRGSVQSFGEAAKNPESSPNDAPAALLSFKDSDGKTPDDLGGTVSDQFSEIPGVPLQDLPDDASYTKEFPGGQDSPDGK